MPATQTRMTDPSDMAPTMLRRLRCSLERHGGDGCCTGDRSLGTAPSLSSGAWLAHGVERDVRLVVRPCAGHRVAEAVDCLDGEGRRVSGPSNRGPAGRDALTAAAARDPRLRDDLRVGARAREAGRAPPRARDTLHLLRRDVRRLWPVRAEGGRPRICVLRDRARLLRLSP